MTLYIMITSFWLHHFRILPKNKTHAVPHNFEENSLYKVLVSNMAMNYYRGTNGKGVDVK